jgi:hypothetical protein
MSLTELKPSDHPDCHVMQWTDSEIRFINDRVSAATAPLLERIADLEQAVKYESDLCQQALDSRADLERQLEQARSLIANDAHACTFQSLGQYRSALLAALSNTGVER